MNNPLLIGMTTGGAFLLGCLLFVHPLRNNEVANRWLGVFVLTLGSAMLEIFLHELNLQQRYLLLTEFAGLFRFLSAPTLYLSVLFFVIPARRFQWKDGWHFAPFVLFLLFRIPYFISGQNFRFGPVASAIVFPILIYSLPIQTLVYLWFTFIKLSKHQQDIKKVASSVEMIDLSWLRNFLLVLTVLVFLWLNLSFFNVRSLFDFIPVVYLASIYALAYFSLKQKEIYAFETGDLQEVGEVMGDDGKTEKQKRLSDSQVSYLKVKLEQVMAEEKAYLENDLSLPKLAGKLQISPHEMSYLINEAFGENFFSFVNRYRVEEAKNLLLSQKHEQLNMLGIAFESGFNSKTTFNTTFKKMAGLSPSQFVQSVKNRPGCVQKDTFEPFRH
jgi:AraC-like DNA-binding protein